MRGCRSLLRNCCDGRACSTMNFRWGRRSLPYEYEVSVCDKSHSNHHFHCRQRRPGQVPVMIISFVCSRVSNVQVSRNSLENLAATLFSILFLNYQSEFKGYRFFFVEFFEMIFILRIFYKSQLRNIRIANRFLSSVIIKASDFNWELSL